jgi:hypothetical protein
VRKLSETWQQTGGLSVGYRHCTERHNVFLQAGSAPRLRTTYNCAGSARARVNIGASISVGDWMSAMARVTFADLCELAWAFTSAGWRCAGRRHPVPGRG